MSLFLKAIKTDDGRYFVTLIDKDIVGKKFEENELQLDLTSEYYKGEEKKEEEILRILQKAYSINFVGEKSVELGVSNGFIDKKMILKIKGIPTSQSLSY